MLAEKPNKICQKIAHEANFLPIHFDKKKCSESFIFPRLKTGKRCCNTAQSTQVTGSITEEEQNTQTATGKVVNLGLPDCE